MREKNRIIDESLLEYLTRTFETTETDGVRRVQVSRAELDKDPNLKWNAYVQLLAMSNHEDLTPRQRAAQLAFRYDNEVQNGGHLQYFENEAQHLDGTLEALRELGAEEQRNILAGAIAQLNSSKRRPIETADEFVAKALEGEFSRFDTAFYKAEPTIDKLLQEHLERYADEFIEIME